MKPRLVSSKLSPRPPVCGSVVLIILLASIPATAFALLLTLTLCAPVAVAQSATFHANGAFAAEFFCSGSQTSVDCIDIEVNRGSTAGQTTTFLFYDHSITDLTTGAFQDTHGSGMIPKSAFQVHPQTALLNVDTSTVAGFVNLFCTIDPNTNLLTCNSAPGGVVTGAWTVITPPVTFQNSGTFRFTSPGVTFIATGTADSRAALANVNVLGAAFANVTANVGTNHNTTINVQH